MSQSSPCVAPPRPAEVSPIPVAPLVAPPVPQRRDSLQQSSPVLRKSTSSPAKYSHDKAHTMSAVETSLDDPHSTFTFEARNLWRDSFKILHEFYVSGQLCDVEIQVGKRSIKCHRIVLACCSRYFRTMFTSEMKECRKEIIPIQDIEEIAMESIIKFAYTAKIMLTTENVQSLLYASSILQVETVAYACCDFMKTHLHPSNCIGVRNFAEQHGRLELVNKADTYILENFLGVVDSEEFLSMNAKHLVTLISSLDLNVNSESEVYEAVMKWMKHDVENRKQYLSVLIPKIKLPLLPATYLVENVAKEELLKKDLECRDYLDEAKCYQLSLAHIVPEVITSDRIRPRKSCAGVVFCVGGRGTSGDPFKSIECYDLRRDYWFEVSEMSNKRRHVGVVSLAGKLFAVGGHDGTDHLCSGEVFEPTTNKWKPIAPMATLRRGIALACLGGPIYAVGGLDDSTCFSIVERYDPESDTWSHVQPMNSPRGGVAVAALKAYLYAVGGNDGISSLNSCERYDPHLNKWTMVANMNKRRAGAGITELNGLLYVVGGFDDNMPLDSVETYDPKTNTWTVTAKMSCPRGGVGVASLGCKLLAVGGHDGTNYLSSVEMFDPITGSWESAAGICTCRAGAGIAVVQCHVDELRDTCKSNMAAAAGRL